MEKSRGGFIGGLSDGRALPVICLVGTLLWLSASSLGEILGYGILCTNLAEEVLFFSLQAISAACLVSLFVLRGKRSRLWAYAAGCACYAADLCFFPFSSHALVALIACVLLPFCLYEAYPRNIFLALGSGLCFFASRWVGSTVFFLPVLSFQDSLAFLFLPALFSALAGSALPLAAAVSRTKADLIELTKLNLSYQDYSATVAERSAMEERKRISRDIHDTVGYALTNAIMMMEAASLMAGREPGKVEEFIDKARSGTESALADVRVALRGLRRDDELRFTGPVALSKTVKIFRLATKADVELDFGNFSWDLDEQRSTIVYHFIQEGMLNAFNHGRADRIRVSLRREGGDLLVSIHDNGRGAEKIEEGIGISGTRERLERVGGRLEYRNALDGFVISLRMPEAGE